MINFIQICDIMVINDEYYRISNEHYNLCSYAAKTGNLDNLKYLLKKQYTDVLCIATIHGHLHCIKYIMDIDKKNIKHFLKYTIDITKKDDKYKISKQAEEAAVYAIDYGQLDCFKYLNNFIYEKNQKVISIERAAKRSAENGNLEFLKYAIDILSKTKIKDIGYYSNNYVLSGLSDRAAEYGHLNCLKYTYKYGINWSLLDDIHQQKNGNLTILDIKKLRFQIHLYNDDIKEYADELIRKKRIIKLRKYVQTRIIAIYWQEKTIEKLYVKGRLNDIKKFKKYNIFNTI
jgi:hypothetical protein